MIYFRTDANEKIAAGHVMRCMTIAFQLQKMGEKIKFLFRDQSSVAVSYTHLDVYKRQVGQCKNTGRWKKSRTWI